MESSGLEIKGDPTKLFEELAKAQAEFDPVPRLDAGQVGNTKFKYAGYATLMKCVRPALSKYGIAIVQPLHSSVDENGTEVAVSTTILAGHGASIISSLSFEHDSNPQEFGRKHTYHRRYQLQSMLGIEGDDDADAPKPKENKEGTQFSEPAPKAASNGKPAPVASVSTPVNDKTASSAEPTKQSNKPAGTATSLAPEKGPEHPAKSINVLLEEAMKQLNWNMSKMLEFYKEHVDSTGIDKPSNMKLEQKRALHDKLVEIHQVAPF